jgi:hypothetical protein
MFKLSRKKLFFVTEDNFLNGFSPINNAYRISKSTTTARGGGLKI